MMVVEGAAVRGMWWRRSGGWAAMITMILACLAPGTFAAPAGRVPVPTRSLYVRSTEPAILSEAGCSTGKMASEAAAGERFAVVLVFGGISTNATDEWVFDLYREASASAAEVTTAVRAYISAYERCAEDAARVPLTLVVGTTTSRGTINRAAGAGFATMVDGLVRSIGDRPGITLLGGNDIELGYVRPGVARAWVDAYHAATDRYGRNWSPSGCSTRGVGSEAKPYKRP